MSATAFPWQTSPALDTAETKISGVPNFLVRQPPTKECPNCHNANKYGDYEGLACEVCGGEGFISPSNNLPATTPVAPPLSEPKT